MDDYDNGSGSWGRWYTYDRNYVCTLKNDNDDTDDDYDCKGSSGGW